jgi:hypothetical protein
MFSKHTFGARIYSHGRRGKSRIPEKMTPKDLKALRRYLRVLLTEKEWKAREEKRQRIAAARASLASAKRRCAGVVTARSPQLLKAVLSSR